MNELAIVLILVFAGLSCLEFALLLRQKRGMPNHGAELPRMAATPEASTASNREENGIPLQEPNAADPKKQTALLQLCADLIGSLDADEIWQRVAGIAAYLLPADACVFLTLDGDGRLTFRAAAGWDPSPLDESVESDGACFAALVLNQKAPMRIRDLAAEKSCALSQAAVQRGFRSGVAVPFTVNGQTNGVMMALTVQTREFSADQLHLMSAIAGQGTASLESACFQRRTNQQLGELAIALQDMNDTYLTTLEAFSEAVDGRDRRTDGHSRRVSLYALIIGQAMGLSRDEMLALQRGALLHDIGQIGLPDAILLKQGILTVGQWTALSKHPIVGCQILSKVEFLRKAMPVILYHHERYDGSGYPFGIAGEDIPLGARIFAVADALDAITSDRPNRMGKPFATGREEFIRSTGSDFDPQVVNAFLSIPAEDWEAYLTANSDEIGQFLSSFIAGQGPPVRKPSISDRSAAGAGSL